MARTLAQEGLLQRAGLDDPVGWARLFCLVTGPFLLLDGLFGLLLAPTSFRIGDQLPREEWNFFFHFNGWHNAWHVVNGLVLTAGALRRSWAAVSAIIFGAGYAIMAPLGFADGDDILNILYSGVRENLVHTAFAITGLAFGLLGLRTLREHRPRLNPIEDAPPISALNGAPPSSIAGPLGREPSDGTR